MIDLRHHFIPGQTILGCTNVQEDCHIWKERRGAYLIKAVYPHWLDTVVKKTGRRATFGIGDVVMSGLLDPYINAGPRVRRDK